MKEGTSIPKRSSKQNSRLFAHCFGLKKPKPIVANKTNVLALSQNEVREHGVNSLFDSLRASSDHQEVLSSTVLAYLETSGVRESDSEYYSYMLKQLSRKEKLDRHEFFDLLLNIQDSEQEVDDLSSYFEILDTKKQGFFKKEEFMEIFRYGSLYQSNPAMYEAKVDELFVYIEKVLGRKEIKKTDFLTFMNLHQ